MIPAHAGDPAGSALVAAWASAAVTLAVLVAPYVWGVRRYHDQMPRTWDQRRIAAWLVGALAVAVALTPAVGDGARGHMVQHVLLGMVGPLGLVLGAPVTLLLGASGTRTRHRVLRLLGLRGVRLVANPVPAAVLHVGGLYLLYLTPVYALTLRHDAVHHLVHLHFLVAGCLFTWAVAGPDPAPLRPGRWVRLTVLVLAAGAHSALAKLLYAGAGGIPPGSGEPAAELRAAAQLMYYAGDLVEVVLAIALFAAWPGRRRIGGLAPGPGVR